MKTQSLSISVLLHNIRSAHNVGALFRTADAMDVQHVYCSGYTPHPLQAKDSRLPHVAKKAHAMIAKTALGAEESIASSYHANAIQLIQDLHSGGHNLIAVEQDRRSVPLESFIMKPEKRNIVLVLGNEVDGIEPDILEVMDEIVEIPMLGSKESLNVSAAGAIALHWLRFTSSM